MSWQWFGNQRLYLLASDVVFMKALANTVFFVIIVCPVQAGLALLLALLINQPLRGIKIFRTIYFTPVVISMVIVAILWRFIYDGENGLLNHLLGSISLGLFEPVDWLGNKDTALPAIMGMSVWQGVGFHMVIWLSDFKPFRMHSMKQQISMGHQSGRSFDTSPGRVKEYCGVYHGDHHHAGIYPLSSGPGYDSGGRLTVHKVLFSNGSKRL